MRHFRFATMTAMLCLAPSFSYGQGKQAVQAERKIGVILDEFSDEMRGYERELKHFQNTAGARPLMELRLQLVEQVNEMKRLDVAGRGTGPAVLNLARDMDRNTRALDAGTAELERRADAVAGGKDREVAGRMKKHADLMVKSIDQVITMFR